VEELEKPLISLGLCNNREDVQKIIDEVDEDDSGQIEFNEFLHIIKSASQKKTQRKK
jgi:Ca2+-binding EF-hand superfamily protein